MNGIINRSFGCSLAIVIILGISPAVCANFAEFQQQEAEVAQRRPFEDPIRRLNLTPEQWEEIRKIREPLREERAELGRRVRETRRALEEALESEAPDEAVIEELLRNAAEAQAAEVRLRVLTEVRIRKVLTPEQLATLRTLRQQALQFRRERSRNAERLRESFSNPRRQSNRNGNAPILPGERRRDQQGTPRP